MIPEDSIESAGEKTECPLLLSSGEFFQPDDSIIGTNNFQSDIRDTPEMVQAPVNIIIGNDPMNQLVHITKVRNDDRVYVFNREPAVVHVHRLQDMDGIFQLTYDPLSICEFGESVQECLNEFGYSIDMLWQGYVDYKGKLTDGAKRLRKRIMQLCIRNNG